MFSRLIPAVCFTFLLAPLVFSQADTINIPEVVIGARRLQAFRAEGFRLVQLIQNHELKKLPAAGANEQLLNGTGLDIRQRGVGDMQADIAVRGGSFEQTLLLVNGVSFNNPQSGHLGADFPFDPSLCEKIEIIRGPAASLFCANAFSGAVNIVSPEQPDHTLKSGLSAGPYGTGSAWLRASVQYKNAAHFFVASGAVSDGYRLNTDYQSRKLFYILTVPLFHGQTSIQAGGTAKAFGAQGFYSAKYPEQFERTESEFASARWAAGKKIQSEILGYWKRNHDRFDLFRNHSPSWYSGPNFHRSDAAGASTDLCVHTGLGTTSLGYDFRYEGIHSNVLGFAADDTIFSGREGFGLYNRSAFRNWHTVRVNHYLQKKIFRVSGGALITKGEHIPFRLDPGLDLSFLIRKAWSVFVSVNTSYRLPSYTEMFYSGPQNRGNPDLQPEEAVTAETGFSWTGTSWSVLLAFYFRDGNNLIDWGREADSVVWTTRNIRNISAAGNEVSIKYCPPLNSNRSSGLYFVNLSYTGNFLEMDKGAVVSQYLPDYLRHKIVLSAAGRFLKRGECGLTILWSDRNGSFTDAQSGAEVDYDPVLLGSVMAGWNFQGCRLWAKCSNIFDRVYYDYGNIPMPGRWISAGADLTIQLKRKTKAPGQ